MKKELTIKKIDYTKKRKELRNDIKIPPNDDNAQGNAEENGDNEKEDDDCLEGAIRVRIVLHTHTTSVESVLRVISDRSERRWFWVLCHLQLVGIFSLRRNALSI